MGADLLIEWFAAPPERDEERDYKAALDVVAEMRQFVKDKPWINTVAINEFLQEFEIRDYEMIISSVGHWHPNEYIDAVEVALKAMRGFETSHWRFKSENNIGDWSIYIVGDSSWGDPPPEPYGHVQTLKYGAGKVWRTLGYGWPEKVIGDVGIARKTVFSIRLNELPAPPGGWDQEE